VRHLRRRLVGGLLARVPLLRRLRVAAEPRHGRLRPRPRHRLRRRVVVLDAGLLVTVAADERLPGRRALDLHDHVAVLDAI